MDTKSDELTSLECRGLELEYANLKSEMLKRIEMRQQIVSITLTLAGVFLAVGLGIDGVVLIYPPLAAFLAFGWGQNDYRIRTSAKYIREQIESRMPGLNYETFVQKQRGEGEGLGAWRFVVFSHGGIFFITQLMAIGIGLLKFNFTSAEWALLVLDIIAALVVLLVMRQALGQWRKSSEEIQETE